MVTLLLMLGRRILFRAFVGSASAADGLANLLRQGVPVGLGDAALAEQALMLDVGAGAVGLVGTDNARCLPGAIIRAARNEEQAAMKAIKAKGTVEPDHSVRLQLPDDVQPGEHVFILVLDERESAEHAMAAGEPGAWPAGFFSQVLGQWQGDLTRDQPAMPDEPPNWA